MDAVVNNEQDSYRRGLCLSLVWPPSDSASLTATWLASFSRAYCTPPAQRHVCSRPEDAHAWNPASSPNYDMLRSFKGMTGNLEGLQERIDECMQTSATVRFGFCPWERPLQTLAPPPSRPDRDAPSLNRWGQREVEGGSREPTKPSIYVGNEMLVGTGRCAQA